MIYVKFMKPLPSACLVLNNSTGALLVKNTVATLTALDDIPRLQSVLHSTISTDVAHRLWLRIHLELSASLQDHGGEGFRCAVEEVPVRAAEEKMRFLAS
uniref:Uncharacterized protein n=2 Tax=Rhizophora mucronata TaxID=61149 RepID=A0A2P2K5D3_RHIMU